MGLDIQTTKNHPGYSENLSASENYKKGLEFAKKHGYSKIEKVWEGDGGKI